ncbi:MAG TPA: hypothetical protein PLZ57_13240 [Pseudobdellovibrionaceae bacterium]|nr:hypothetical protein [Pseudobdellovibrionaceae bacterium]
MRQLLCQTRRLSAQILGHSKALLTSVIPALTFVQLAFVEVAASQTAQAPAPTDAQSPRVEQAAVFTSPADDFISIRKISVLPGADNVDGIFVRPIEAHLMSLLKSSHRWEYADTGLVSLPKSPIELEDNPSLTQQLLAPIQVDAVILPSITKGPTGLSIRLSLIMKADGRVLLQEQVKDLNRFEIAEVKNQVSQIYQRLIRKIPYDGLILSRQGNRVTLNLGRVDGVQLNQDLAVVQVISLNRHPKFGFLISNEKEILGRIRVLKVDDTLSFAVVTAEKERGAIRRLNKIAGLNAVEYGTDQTLTSGTEEGSLQDRPDHGVAFGAKAEEWLPIREPSFGQVGVKAGLGMYKGGMNLSGVGALEAKSDFYPLLEVDGELWLNPNWTVQAEITQGILSTANPRTGASPATLNHALNKYSISLAYNFLMRNDFFGPKFQFRGGLSYYRMYVDDSTPQGLTTVNYNGVLTGVGIYFPLGGFANQASDPNERLRRWAIGGDLSMLFLTKLTESPIRSGDSSSNTINEFSFFVDRRLAMNLILRSQLEFALYSSSLTGSGNRTEPATSISQRHISASAGIIYQF